RLHPRAGGALPAAGRAAGVAALRRRGCEPVLDVRVVDLTQGLLEVVLELPLGIVAAELRQVGDPPAVVADAVAVPDRPLERPSRDPLAQRDRLAHRTA